MDAHFIESILDIKKQGNVVSANIKFKSAQPWNKTPTIVMTNNDVQ